LNGVGEGGGRDGRIEEKMPTNPEKMGPFREGGVNQRTDAWPVGGGRENRFSFFGGGGRLRISKRKVHIKKKSEISNGSYGEGRKKGAARAGKRHQSSVVQGLSRPRGRRNRRPGRKGGAHDGHGRKKPKCLPGGFYGMA